MNEQIQKILANKSLTIFLAVVVILFLVDLLT
jgi:hypothetical protein